VIVGCSTLNDHYDGDVGHTCKKLTTLCFNHVINKSINHQIISNHQQTFIDSQPQPNEEQKSEEEKE